MGVMGSAATTVEGGAGVRLALKEWGAAVHALLDGRQTLLLRKGGIHERRFEVARDAFVLFPTVAHSHRERVRGEHHDLLAPGAADVSTAALTLRAGVTLYDVVEVRRPEGLAEVADLHIWTPASVQRDRLDFRPRLPLQVLVARVEPLPEPVVLERREEYGGCRSWVELPVAWVPGTGAAVHREQRLAEDAARVRAAVA